MIMTNESTDFELADATHVRVLETNLLHASDAIFWLDDPPGHSPENILAEIKKSLAAELPAMFGFSVYNSIPAVGDGNLDIPYPKRGDTLEGGHAVLAVGYDDDKKINGETGAILIRNSWGTQWGDKGYGWLPYKYVLNGLADDFWSLVKADFLDTDLFN